MHKVKIHPGICGLITDVTAELIEDDMVKVIIKSDCQAIDKINSILGDQFDAFEVCLVRPGEDPFTSCPTISGIIKCIEAEAGLALPKDVQINFIKE